MTENTTLTLDRIFKDKEFKSQSFGPARWLDDGVSYTTLLPLADDDKVKEIVRTDIPSGETAVLVSAESLTPDGADKPLIIEDYHWSDDKTKLLIFSNSKRVWRLNTRGDYWVLNLDSGQLSQLGGDFAASSLMFAKFSPDNNYVAYVHKNNIYVESLVNRAVIPLTTDGSESIINGTSDWVYEEEFHLRDGFCWSPNGQQIAYWQFDTEGIETFYMINNTDSLYPKLIPLPYPKVGTINSACRVGVVNVTGGETTWFAVPGDPRQHYIPKMEWAANSEQVVIQQLNRLQNENRVMLGNAKDGSVEMIMTERDEAWVDLHDNLKWVEDGQSFTWLSERDGWRHLYLISRNGRKTILLTAGNYDVINIQEIDEENGWVYFIASPDNATQRYLYRVPLNGSGKAERLTPDLAGSHAYQISPQANYAFHTFSAFAQPPIISLISLPDHQQLQILEGNQALQEKVAALNMQPVEFFTINIADDVILDGWCLKPPDFDESQKYPVLFYVYGEPANTTVNNRWAGNMHLWHQMMAQRGYVVISVDNRGTPAAKGCAWRKMVYRQVGILATEDQAAAAKALLAERPYLDASRVGVWGWSGGGSMTLNLMFKHPNIYHTGIAVAAVSNQRFYDTIYQERYMGLPDDNEDGFRDGSPITFAHQLEGNLLMIHGTGDDNVHYQCFETIVNELIKHNKHFSMMAYPNRSHGIREGKNTSRHLYSLMTRYLQENLLSEGDQSFV